MKREQKQRLNNLIKDLQEESKKRKSADLKELRKPYYYKGRFDSLTPKGKREKIRAYYKQELENIQKDILELANMGEELETLTACVEWSKSPTWGYNPHAKAIINNKYVGFGSASGCGYDKLSACVCYACNDNENIKRLILSAIIKSHLKTGKEFPYGIYKSTKIYLHFDGCGISTLRTICEYCDLKQWEHHETRTSDYIIVKK